MSDLRVLNDNILLLPYKAPTTKNGIIIPETSQKQRVINTTCFISVVGPKVIQKDILTEGTAVIIPRHTGTRVPFEGEEYILVKEDDILAVFDDVKMESPNKE